MGKRQIHGKAIICSLRLRRDGAASLLIKRFMNQRIFHLSFLSLYCFDYFQFSCQLSFFLRFHFWILILKMCFSLLRVHLRISSTRFSRPADFGHRLETRTCREGFALYVSAFADGTGGANEKNYKSPFRFHPGIRRFARYWETKYRKIHFKTLFSLCFSISKTGNNRYTPNLL